MICLRTVLSSVQIVDYGSAQLTAKSLPALLLMRWAVMAKKASAAAVATLRVEESAWLAPACIMIFAAH
jgi:hypothetical protein